MKKFLLLTLLVSSSLLVKSQENSNCFNEWYATVHKYGSQPVADGTHEVIITIRKDEQCKSMQGKVDVKDNKIVRGTLWLLKTDGTYEKPERTLSNKYTTNSETKLDNSIINGMSPSFMTSQGEQINFFFYKSFNKTPREYKPAPKPSEIGF